MFHLQRRPVGRKIKPADTPTAASRAIYSGRDRLGSCCQFDDGWAAFDRLGRPISQYRTELRAANAIAAVGEVVS